MTMREDWTASMRSPADQARISELERDNAELNRRLQLAETEARVWQGRYEVLDWKLNQIRGIVNG